MDFHQKREQTKFVVEFAPDQFRGKILHNFLSRCRDWRKPGCEPIIWAIPSEQVPFSKAHDVDRQFANVPVKEGHMTRIQRYNCLGEMGYLQIVKITTWCKKMLKNL